MAIERRRAPRTALAVLASFLVSSLLSAQYLVIHSFATDDGFGPRSGLVQDANGKLYGAAPNGGENANGTVFKLDPDGQNFVVLHAFDNSDGDDPKSDVILGAGFLFGTAEKGGTAAAGVVYKVDTNGNNFSVVHHLNGTSDGSTPTGRLVQGPDTILYGVAHDDGANGFGTVFSVEPGGANFTVIHVFGSTGNDGSGPFGGLLMASDGMLYGTTEKGHNGSGLGTVFRLNTDGSNFETLHTFTGSLGGQDPTTPLFETPDGYIWGTTVFGGSSSSGTVYKLRRDGTDFQIVHAFAGSEGTDPKAPLVRITGGLLYGTASSGGSGGGTIYRLTIGGQLVDSAHDFTAASGSNPQGAVLEGIDGALYGMTSSGGANSLGAIYRMTTPKVLSITPDSGPASGGTAVTIAGSGFVNQATAALSGSMMTNVDVVNGTTITATTPNLAPGQLHDLSVVNTDASIGFLERAWLADFLDVPGADNFHDYVEAIVRAGITAGCGGGNYCRNNPVTRAQMAVFILKAKHGQFYLPPDCTQVFDDVDCPANPFADWIEELFVEGIAVGCGGNNYCPNNAVTRAQMSAFLLKGKFGSSHVPPPCSQDFDDVACPGNLFAAWISELVDLNITAGCGGPNYCPSAPNTRGQMAVFLTKTFLTP